MRAADTSKKSYPFNARAITFISGAAIVLLTLIALAGANFSGVLYRLLTDGVVLVLWLASAWGWGRLFVKDRVVSAIALGLGIIGLLMLGLGLRGLISSVVAWGIIFVGVVALVGSFWRAKLTARTAKPQAKVVWVWMVAMPVLGIAIFGALMPPGLLWGDEPHGYDVVEYHLQVPREWYEAGKIVGLKHNAFSYFPFNVEMHYLLAMELRGGPWNGMYLAQLMHVAMCALACAAVWEMTGSHLAGALCACAPWTAMLAPVAYNEGGMLLYAALAIGWSLRARTLREFALAGVFAGLACGVKLTAVPILLIALPVILLVLSWPRMQVSGVLVFVAAGVLTFSPWLIRNFAWTHNPVFPEAQSIFGKAHFSDEQSTRWKLAHSAARGSNPFAAAVQQILSDFRFGYVLLPLGIIAIALSFKCRETKALALLLLALLVFWLFITHLQGRFFVLAIPICAMLIAQVQWKLWPPIVTLAAIVLLIVTLTNLWPRLEKFAGVIGVDDLHELTPPMLADVPKDRKVYLVGDAKAFYYQRPMSKLVYRTVFDVDGRDKSVIDAWLGVKRPTDGMIIIDPVELQRFSKTYHAIPPLTNDVSGPRDQPFILPR